MRGGLPGGNRLPFPDDLARLRTDHAAARPSGQGLTQGKYDMLRFRLAAPATLGLALMVATPLAAAPPVRVAESVPAAIHDIQGTGLTSPLAGSTVITEGIVTARTLNGFVIQSAPGQEDGLPATSQGLFVELGQAPGTPSSVGNLVRVTGTVAEFRPVLQPHQMPLTRLENITAQLVLATGQPLPAAVTPPPQDMAPNSDIAALERFEGMRVTVPELVVVGAAGATIDETARTAQSDGVVYVMAGLDVDNTNRPFREPGLPLLDASVPPAGKSLPVFDGNPEVLRVDSRAQPGAPLLDLGADDVLLNAVGVLGQDDGRYSLLIDQVSALQVLPAARGEGAAYNLPGEIKLMWYDLGRLFDASDDPSRAEPVPSLVRYQARLDKIARGLCGFVANPEIIAVSGAENIQVLRDLAAVIDTNPSTYCPDTANYQSVLMEGQDPSGLDVGFLLKGFTVDGVHPKVEVIESEQIAAADVSAHPAGGSEPLFAQPPLRATLRITDPMGRQTELTAVVVKFQPLDGADSPEPGGNGWATKSERVMTLRARQAARLATWLQARQTADPEEAIAVLGGFEADAFNDGRVDVVGIVTGRTAPAEQTWVAVASPVTTPLDSLTTLAPAYARWNADDRGNARALDHILVNQAMRAKFAVTPIHPRMNAGFPATQQVAGGLSFTTSGRDPVIARVGVAEFVDADTQLEFFGEAEPSSRVDTRVYFSVTNLGPDPAPALELRIASSLAASRWSVSTEYPGWTCGDVQGDGAGSVAHCVNTQDLVATDNHSFEILIPADLTLDGQTALFTGTLTGAHSDPDPSNNQVEASVTFNNKADLKVSISDSSEGKDLVPPQPGSFFANITRIGGPNAPGPSTVVVTIDATVAETDIDVGYGNMTCAAGVNIGPRRSRFICVLADNNMLEMAAFSVAYTTGLGDGRRVIGLTVEVTPTTAENTPLDNIASLSRRVSDDVDLVLTQPTLIPEPGRLDEPMAMFVQVSNAVEGVARNARVQIDMNVPPAVLGTLTVTPYFTSVTWTCGPPQAAAGGSRVVCLAPPLLQEPPQQDPYWQFLATFDPDYRPGLAQYPLTVEVIASSDSEESRPIDNSVSASTVVDQTANLGVAVRAGQEPPVVEPDFARFAIDVLSTGTNAARSPRVVFALDAAFDAQDLMIVNSLGQSITCVTLAAPAGATRRDCPLAVTEFQSLSVYARTRPSLADTTLTLTATVRNDLVDLQPANDVASASLPVIAVADLCVGPYCDFVSPPLPAKINAGGLNTLSFTVKNLGPSTARAAVVNIDVALPAERLSARVDGQACAAAVDTGAGRSRIACAMGDMPGASAIREIQLDVQAGGLDADNIALSVEATSPVTDPAPANGRLELTLPVAPLMDLSVEVSSKVARYPGNASFLLTLAAAGPPNIALSELYLRLETPGGIQLPQVSGAGWECRFVDGYVEVSNFSCRRTSPLSGGVPSQLQVVVPTAGFQQIGTHIRVLAEHFYRPDALANDRTPANNLVNHVRRVEGRSTKSVRTPAYGGKPAAAPKPAPARAAPARLN